MVYAIYIDWKNGKSEYQGKVWGLEMGQVHYPDPTCSNNKKTSSGKFYRIRM